MLVVHERQSLFEAPAPAATSTAVSATEAASVSIFSNIADAESIWRAFEATADCTAFQTYAWHAAWQRHIGDAAGAKPAIVIGRVRGQVAFILPFAIEPARMARRLVWHASDLCDYNAPLLAPDFASVVHDFPALFGQILERIGKETPFDAVLLPKMPDHVGGQPNPFLALPNTLNPSSAYLVHLGKDWESFYAAKRSSATRRRDRTKRKRLADIGPVTFTTPESEADVRENLAMLLEQKGNAFAAMGVTNFLARPEVRNFFFDIATDPAMRGFVHVSHLDVGPTMAATNLGLVFRGVYYHVLASYDAGPASKFGPGAAHLHELMTYAIARGCTAFDFTIGDERYKREWSDVVIKLYDHRCAVTLRGYLAALPGLAISEAKRLIKQSPVLWPLALRVRERLYGRKLPTTKADEVRDED
jgi:CelD/BcsL family acetyltransferase involved in cellulose biosynthesis